MSLKEKPAKVAPLLIDEREAARLLGCCQRTVWAIRQAGDIPHIRLRGSVRYALSDLEKYIADQRVSASAS